MRQASTWAGGATLVTGAGSTLTSTGAITVSGGTLTMPNGGAVSAGSVTIGSGSTVLIDGSNILLNVTADANPEATQRTALLTLSIPGVMVKTVQVTQDAGVNPATGLEAAGTPSVIVYSKRECGGEIGYAHQEHGGV